jgi:Glycosyl hydrolase family 12
MGNLARLSIWRLRVRIPLRVRITSQRTEREIKVRNILAAVVTAAITVTGASAFAYAPDAYSVTPVWSVTAPPFSNSMAGHQFGGYIISNNMWNCQDGCQGATGNSDGTQTIWGNSSSDWGVTANLGGTTGTAVLTYPEDQQIWTLPDNTDEPLSDFAFLHGNATENMPHASLDAEAAYDIWAGPTGETSGNFATEIMIWLENHGQTPAGHVVGTTSWYGQTFTVWSETGNHVITFVLNGTQARGTTHILSAMNYLRNHGMIAKNYGLAQIDFGFEICNTGGTAENFNVTSYNVTDMLKS